MGSKMTRNCDVGTSADSALLTPASNCHMTQSAARPPDSQRGEQDVDLSGSDPSPCSLQPLVEVGGTLRI